jgi:hypothetical protein
MNPVSADQLRDLLRAGRVEVTFEKADGTVRKGMFTLDPKLLPERLTESKDDGIKHAPNQSVVTMYDLIKKGWRSCAVERIISFEVFPS